MTTRTQEIGLPGVANARELGGYPTLDGSAVKSGVLLRTAELGKADPDELIQGLARYRVAHVIDLRSTRERLHTPEPELPQVTGHSLKIVNEKKLEQAYIAHREQFIDPALTRFDLLKRRVELGLLSQWMYVDFLRDEVGKTGYRAFFRILLDNREGDGVLWHCTHGKDRTGVAAMLLLSALEVDEEIIMEDFLLSNRSFAVEIAQTRRRWEPRVEDPEVLEDMLIVVGAVREVYMRNALDYLKSNHTSPLGYIKSELGLTDRDLDKLKQLYLRG